LFTKGIGNSLRVMKQENLKDVGNFRTASLLLHKQTMHSGYNIIFKISNGFQNQVDNSKSKGNK
jgi:hypothetical protein